jgi:hypothetical protein
MAKISLYTKWKLTLNKAEVQLQQIKKLLLDRFQFEQNRRSSCACSRQFKCSVFIEQKFHALKSFLEVSVAQVNHRYEGMLPLTHHK